METVNDAPPVRNINLDTNFLKKLKVNFKPSLLTRIILQGGASDDTNLGASETYVKNMVGGAGKTVDLSDMKQKDMPSFVDHFMARGYCQLFFLTLAMYLASRIIGSKLISGHIMSNVDLMDPEMDYEGKELSPKEVFILRYKKIMILLMLFIAISAILLLVIQHIPLLILYVYFNINKKKNDNVWFLAKESFDNIFYKFVSRTEAGNMNFYISIQRYALYGIFLYFLIYYFFVKSFINNMSYPRFMEDEEQEATVERKFLLHYSLVVLYMVMFSISLFCIHFEFTNPITIIYTFIIIGLYSVFVSYAFYYDMTKRPLQVFLYLIVGLGLLVFLNYKFLT